MIIEEEKIIKDGSEIVLRCARADEAEMVLKGFIKVSGETRFLVGEPDEIKLTVEQEREFIEGSNSNDKKLLLLAFVDGRYAGNCRFDGKTATRKFAHRASLGIALLQEFTGRGLGGIMLEKLLSVAKQKGYEQMELTVYSENIRARKLYKRLGFKECGAIPDAVKFSDGTTCDEIYMYKKL